MTSDEALQVINALHRATCDTGAHQWWQLFHAAAIAIEELDAERRQLQSLLNSVTHS